MSNLSDRERAIRQRLKDDFLHYAPRCLKVRTKKGDVAPFELNRSQLFLHERLEEQLKRTGKVRALVLKARQVGISTYISGRFYHKITHRKGFRAFILAHLDMAADNLFEMAKRYHDNCPALVKPATGASNAKELSFSALNSGYKVATAGSKEVGRSETIQMFHACLSPDTQIVDGTTGALRRMGSMRLGDMVRTHTGAVAPVSVISHQRKYAFKATFKGMGQMPLVATGEHRFLTHEGWKELSSIQAGDKLLFPVTPVSTGVVSWPFRLPDAVRPQGGGSRETGPDFVEPTYELGRILGLYLAEGCLIHQRKSGVPSAITFGVHEREAKRTEEWLDAVGGLFKSRKTAPCKTSKTVSVTVYGKSFASFVLSLCGELDSKRLPDQWCKCGEDFVRGVVHGYLSGDGHSSRREYDRRITAPSIRSAISIGMRDALASLGYGWASIGYHAGRSRYGKICKPIWYLQICGTGVDKLCSELGWEMPPRRRTGAYGAVEIVDGYARIPVLDIEDVGEIEVMDFEIDHEDHSYCTVQAATHNSEFGFWPNAQMHSAGISQAIADAPGTEDIRESTANGIGNAFHSLWKAAERGESDYEAIFIPWFWHEEYVRTPPTGWVAPEQFSEYARYYGLSSDQLYWAFCKNRDLAVIAGGSPEEINWKFKQEFPANSNEAFQTSGELSFIEPEKVLKARKAEVSPYGPLILGVDPARAGGDKTAIVDRQGRVLGGNVCKVLDYGDLMAVAGEIVILARDLKPKGLAKIAIDVTGLGAGLYDRLKEQLGDLVAGVNFGSQAYKRDAYVNRRAEMWDQMRQWFDDPAGVKVPDTDEFQGDVCAPIRGPGATHFKSNGQLVLEPKDKIRDRLSFSPDLGDAAALTFSIDMSQFTSVDWADAFTTSSVFGESGGNWLRG